MVKDPNVLLEPQYSTQLPGVIGCNLILLGVRNLGGCMGLMLSRSSAAQIMFIQ